MEEVLIDRVVRESDWHWADAQRNVVYYSPSFDATIQGHIDGIAYRDNGKEMVGEVKTTSDNRFNEVVAAIRFPDEVKSEQLERYRTQMRRYAAMIWKEEPVGESEFLPTFGVLVVFNRDTCECLIETIPLFGEDEDLDEFLEETVREAFGQVHPDVAGEVDDVPLPKWAYRSHPICDTCYLHELCYGERTQPADDFVAPFEGLQLVEMREASDRYLKLGESLKKTTNHMAERMMDDAGTDRIVLTPEGHSVSRYSRAGNRKLDIDRMKADDVYDTYSTAGQPYKVVRFGKRG